MIISLKKAVLHICDVNNGINMISNTELDVTDGSINAYVTSHVERAFNSPTLKKGTFVSNSGLRYEVIEYTQKRKEFLNLSEMIAERLYDSVSACSKPQNVDVIICEFDSNSEKFIGILKLDSKYGYVHKSMFDEGKTINTLVNSAALMPSGTQTLSEFAFINESDLSIKYASKKFMVEGERTDIMADSVLECVCEAASSKEVLSTVNRLIRKISEKPLESTVKFKKGITDKIDAQSDKYSLDEVADQILSCPSQKHEFMECAIKTGIIGSENEKITIDDYTVKKTSEKIKIVTDNGFEIKFPSYLFEKDDGIQIEQDDSGKLTIKLNGVQEYSIK